MSARRRVLLVLHHAERAGTEWHALYLARGLQELGWEVHVAWSRCGPMEGEFLDAEIPVHLVPRGGRRDPGYLLRLARLLRRVRPDVLHAHSGRLAALAARIVRVPAVVETRHGLGDAAVHPTPERLRDEARRSRIAHRTIVVTPSDGALLREGGLDPARVCFVANGIPLPREHIDEGETGRSESWTGRVRVGFLGRMTPQKDPLFLLDIACFVRAAAGPARGGDGIRAGAPPRIDWVIAGDGPLAAQVRAGLLDRVEDGRLTWLGEIEEARPLLEGVDILLVPSIWEGQPLAVLEAMGSGVLVLAADIPSLRDLLSGDPPAGMLLTRDAGAWAGAIRDLGIDPGRREAILREARRRVADRHSIARMAAETSRVYEEILVGRRSP